MCGVLLLVWISVAGILAPSSSMAAVPRITCGEIFRRAHLIPGSTYHLTLLSETVDVDRLPQVLAETLVGYPLPGQEEDTMAYHVIKFAVFKDEVDTEGHYCLFPESWSMRLITDIKEFNFPPEHLESDAWLSSKRNGEQEELVAQLLAQGFREVSMEGNYTFPTHVLLGNISCRTCDMYANTLRYNADVDFINWYFQSSRRISISSFKENVQEVKDLLSELAKNSHLSELVIHDSPGYVDPGILYPYLASLRTLALSSIGLSNFIYENFRRVPNVLHLYLGGNKFTRIPRGLRLLSNLISLDLSHNPISAQDLKETLRVLKKLRWLSICHIALGNLDILNSEDGVLSRLEYLDMSWCGIKSLDTAKDLFGRHQTLQSVLLSGNPLKYVSPDAFSLLPNLKVLDLSEVQLTAGPKLQLHPEATLQLLSLAGNKLPNPGSILEKEILVQKLDMSGNPIYFWNMQISLSFAKNANFSYCRLDRVSPAMKQTFMKLESVDLGANVFDCSSCESRNLQKWLAESKSVKVLALGASRNLTCTYPYELVNVDILAAHIDACTAWENLSTEAQFSIFLCTFLSIFGIILLLVLFLPPVVSVLGFMKKSKLTVLKNIPSDTFEFDVFICYSSQTRTFTLHKVVLALEQTEPKQEVCVHEIDFKLGNLFYGENTDYMCVSRRILVVLTRTFVKKYWVKWHRLMSEHSIPEDPQNLVLLEKEPLDPADVPESLTNIKETCTYVYWPDKYSLEALALNNLVELLRSGQRRKEFQHLQLYIPD